MAVLPNADRVALWRGIMRYASKNGDSIPVTKPDLQAAVNAADDWLEANAASYNAALPQPFRGSATTGMKAFVLAMAALARFLPGLVKAIMETD